MDKSEKTKNCTNQCNSCHKTAEPEDQSAYQGDVSKPNLDKHGNQKSPTNEKYIAPKKN